MRDQLTSSVDVAPLLLTLATGSDDWRARPELRAARAARRPARDRARPARARTRLRAARDRRGRDRVRAAALRGERAAARHGADHADAQVRDVQPLAARTRSSRSPAGQEHRALRLHDARRPARDREPGAGAARRRSAASRARAAVATSCTRRCPRTSPTPAGRARSTTRRSPPGAVAAAHRMNAVERIVARDRAAAALRRSALTRTRATVGDADRREVASVAPDASSAATAISGGACVTGDRRLEAVLGRRRDRVSALAELPASTFHEATAWRRSSSPRRVTAPAPPAWAAIDGRRLRRRAPGREVGAEVLHVRPERGVEEDVAGAVVLGEVGQAAVAHQPVAAGQAAAGRPGSRRAASRWGS